MELIINNKLISAPIEKILHKIVAETHKPLFHSIVPKGDNLRITCPCHKNGQETHPSCQIYNSSSGDIEYGYVHCFTCGYTAPLYKLVADCFDESVEFGKEWLEERFGNIYVEAIETLPEIKITKPTKKYLDESILDSFAPYHPYMKERKMSDDVIKRFRICYDRSSNSLVFPVWDEHNNLVMLTRRSVVSKKFDIDKGAEKPVYLLNEIINKHITKVYVCESQINTLTLWSWGYPAIGLIGTGSSNQYEILKKSGIRQYILCLDGDEAGDKGTKRFVDNMPKDVFISKVVIPRGKDVNDLDKESFENQLTVDL